MFQNGNSAFLFYEVWGNDPTSRQCTLIVDQFGNETEVCAFLRTTYDYGWGEIAASDFQATATGAELLTTTGPGFAATRCTTDKSGPTPVTTCAPGLQAVFDLKWTTNDFSGLGTVGITQHTIGPFRFKNPGAVGTESAYVNGTALGKDLTDAPGCVGTTKGNSAQVPGL